MRTGTPSHLKSFDYIGLQRYFLMFCAYGRECVFMTSDAVDVALVHEASSSAESNSVAFTTRSSLAAGSGSGTDMRVLRTDEDTLGVAKNILENPVRGRLVPSPQDYQFSGSTRYTVQEILDAVSWKGPKSA